MKKKLLIHSILLGGIMMLLTVLSSYAQDEIVSWRFSNPATTANEEQENEWMSTVTHPKVEESLLKKGPGIIGGSVVRAFGGTSDSWDADNNSPTVRNERDYFEFKIKAKEGYLSLSSIEFKVRRTTQAANKYRWAYKLNNNEFKDIGSEDRVVTSSGGDGAEEPSVNLTGINELYNLTSSDEVIFRLYVWGTTINTASGVFALGRHGTTSNNPSLVVRGSVSEEPIDIINDIVSWRFSIPSSTGSESIYPSTYSDPRVEQSELSLGPGLEAGSYARSFGGTSKSWNATDNNPTTRSTGETTDYFEFKVKGREGYLSLRSINFKVRRNNRGARYYQWSYSLGTSEPVFIGDVIEYTGEETDGLEQPTVDLSNISALKNLTPSDEVTLRLHVWGIDGVTLSGVQYLGRYGSGENTPSLLLRGTVTESPLPVSLVDFNAKSEGDRVRLDWNTASELNNSRFQILRSADGKSFDVIGTVSGKGTTSELTKYGFTDFNPLAGTSYYKLRQIDFNGDYTDSDIRVISVFSRKNSLSVSESNDESLTLFVNIERNTNAELNITSIDGRKLLTLPVVINEGANSLLVPVRLTKGIYVLRLVSPFINEAVKFIKE